MRRAVLLSLALILTFSDVFARNRFNVISYSDYDIISNKRQFYNQLDSFGVSVFQTFIPDEAAKYKSDDNLPIELITHHWSDGFRLWYDNSHLLGFDTCNEYSIDGRMSGANTSEEKGYLVSNTAGVRERDVSLIDQRFVVKARHGVNTAGWLQPEFSRGVFHVLNKNLGVEAIEFEADLKLPDLVTPNPTDTTVVAELIFEDNSRMGNCDTAMHYQYRLERLDDTLLIIGTSSGLDTVPTIDRDTTTSSKLVHFTRCDSTSLQTGTFEGNKLPNVSYQVGSTTISALPYRYIKRVRVKDFTSPGQYQRIRMDCISSGGWNAHWYKIYWTNAATVYLDSFFVTDSLGRSFDAIAYEHTSDAAQKIEDYYSNATTRQAINGFYTADEVYGLNIKSVENAKRIINALPSNYPKKNRGTLGAYNALVSDTFGSKYYDTYVEYSQDSSFIFDFYPHNCWVTSSSEVNNMTSWQWTVDSALAPDQGYKFVAQFKKAQERARAISANKGYPVDWWVVFPSFDLEAEASSGTYVKSYKMFTKQQMRMAVNMALAYGAHGIGYWLYLSHYGCQETNPRNFPKTATDVATSVAMAERRTAYSPLNLDTLCQRYPNSCFCQSTGECDIEGLVNFQGNATVPNTHWHDYQEANKYVDSMAYFFLNATWKSVGRWTDNIRNMSGSFLDSVRSFTHFHNDSAYLQIAFFDYQNTKYAYVVNRRVDSLSGNWDYTRIDTQTVACYWAGTGPFEVREAYSNRLDTVYDSLGSVRWKQKLMPGGATLFTMRPLSVKGSWSGTWPQFSSIKVVGDITVNAGDTLQIKTSGITLRSNVDSLGAGTDHQRIEFNVYGRLRLTGTDSNRVYLGPQPGLEEGNDWYGITCFGSAGKVEAENVVVKYASHRAFTLNGNGDFVKKSRIEDCVDGIYCPQGTYTLQQDTFLSTNAFYSGYSGVDSVGYGMRYGVQQASGSGTPQILQDCYFKDVKYPIYIASASPVVSNCNIVRTGPILSSTIGTPGIWVANSSSPTFSGCRVENYLYGMRLDTNSHVQFSYGEFTSSSYEGINPYMDIGIQAGLATSSSCKVRNTCFDGIHQIAVYAGQSQFDLGTNADRGHNNFIAYQYCPEGTELLNGGDTTFDQQMQQNGVGGPPRDTLPAPCTYGYFPSVIIDNEHPTVHVSAWGNYYDPKYNPLDGHFTGLVDWYYPLSIPETFCGMNNTPPVEKKVDSVKSDAAIKVFSVDQNYPNPFNPTTQISFSLPTASHVTVHVFNVLGQLLKTVTDDDLASGNHTVLWDGRGSDGTQVSSGVYFYRVIAGGNIVTRKMILLR